jgi:hypothetical protein
MACSEPVHGHAPGPSFRTCCLAEIEAALGGVRLTPTSPQIRADSVIHCLNGPPGRPLREIKRLK